MKNTIKKLLPTSIVRRVGGVIVNMRSKKLARMPIADAFDLIYKKLYWKQGNSSSGLGSEGKWASDYCDLISKYIKINNCFIIVDAGCGDFSVGREIAKNVDRYIGLDISKTVIEANKTAFRDVTNASFSQFNLLTDPIPKCDLLLVRQVLQHLSNAQIELVLKNIEKSGVKHTLITEQLLIAPYLKEINLDLGGHSVVTRVARGSGLDVGEPPFSRQRSILDVLEPGVENGAEPGSVLVVYELNGQR